MAYAMEIKQEDYNEYLIIEGEKVVQRIEKNPFLIINKVNLKGFTIHPGRVLYDPAFGKNIKTLQEKKHLFSRLIQQGATLVVTACMIDGSSQLRSQLKKARHKMINSPIDYVIGVSVKIKDLTPALMIDLSKEKIPFIVFMFKDWKEVYSFPWERIRDCIFARGPLLIPHWQTHGERERAIRKRYKEWTAFANAINLPVLEPLASHRPLTKGQLKALGIYPTKGILHPGADCDYVLYPTLLEGENLNGYDKITPSIVAVRGKIQLAGQKIFRPGYGRELKIQMPKRFTDYWECINNDG